MHDHRCRDRGSHSVISETDQRTDRQREDRELQREPHAPGNAYQRPPAIARHAKHSPSRGRGEHEQAGEAVTQSAISA